MKNSFMLYVDQYKPIQTLSLEQKGRLLDAFFVYNMGEDVSFDDPVLAMAFAFFKQAFERDTANYERKCKKNKENIAKRYSNSTNVNDGNDGIRSNTNATYNDNDPDNDPDINLNHTLTTFECVSPPDGGDATPQAERGIPEATEQHGAKAPPCPYEAIRALYHEILPEHPRVEIVNEKRQRAMKARWADIGRRLKAKKQRDGPQERLEYLRRFFTRAAESDFLTGKKAFRDGSVYIADFDKLMSPGGFVGVIEGKYDNRERW